MINVMEVSKVHIRNVMLWEFRKGTNAKLTAKSLCKVYGEGTISVSQCQRWFQNFRLGNVSLKDEPRSGRPVTFHQDLLKKTVEENPMLTVEQLAEKLHSTHSTVHRHLRVIGKVSRLGQWIPCDKSNSEISLPKIIKKEKMEPLNYQTMPLQLDAEPDEQMIQASDQKVSAFSHDFEPNLLGAKADPEVEAKFHAFANKMVQINHDISTNQINTHNKKMKNVMEMLNLHREELELETETALSWSQHQTNSISEAQFLEPALGVMEGIKKFPGRAPPKEPPPGMNSQPPSPTTSKAPSSIKTNIKSAGQVHPYSR